MAALVSILSAGIITVISGKDLMRLISSSAWWLAPSSPTVTPPWVATIFTLSPGCATEHLTWSQALPEANTAKVLKKAILPEYANPAAVPTASCSATPILKNLSGKTFRNFAVWVEQARSASKTTIFLFSFPSSIKVFLDAELKTRAERIWKDIKIRNLRKEEQAENIREIVEKIKTREESEKKRYQKYYQINPYNKKHYDLVIDTTQVNAEQAADKIVEFIKRK